MLRACLVASVLVQPAAAAPLPPTSPPTLPRLGDYLDTAYIQALEKTRSPLQAAREDSRARIPQMVTVQRQGTARRFALNYDWHTGTLLLVLQRNGAIYREMAWGPDPATALRVTATDHFCLTPLHSAEHCYRYIQNVPAFVASQTLAGKYIDRDGAAYRFTPDGHAHFPGYDFTYTPVLDQTDTHYDAFSINTQGRFMAFQRNGALLTLFAITNGHADFAHKLAVLREIPPPRVVASK